MGRPRKSGTKDLPAGLYCDPDTGMYYVKRKGKQASLKTKNKQQALALYAQVRPKWEEREFDQLAERIAVRINRITAPTSAETFSIYAKNWREQILPNVTKKNGAPLATKTRKDYEKMLRRQVESSEHFNVPLSEVTATLLRKFLSNWLDKPNQYNYLKAVISRVLVAAVDEGLLERNPAADVSNRPTKKRDAYLSDDDYIAIVANFSQEWHARACDMLYLLSHRPGDVLQLRESDIKENEIHFTTNKNQQAMEVEMNSDLANTINWFRQWKRKQGINSPHLICHPRTSERGLIGKPVSVEYLSRRFSAAVVAAGLKKGSYTLRDLRPKGLTDEYMIAGDSDKGGHKTEAMKRHYRRVKLPMRAKSNLKRLS